MTRKTKNLQSCFTDFSGMNERTGFSYLPISKILFSNSLISSNLKCAKKTSTGFCVILLACLFQKIIAGYEEDVAMYLIRTIEIVSMLFLLTIFSSNVFAYSKQTLITNDISKIETTSAIAKLSAYTKISRSPDMTNNLRLMFSSNQKSKLPK